MMFFPLLISSIVSPPTCPIITEAAQPPHRIHQGEDGELEGKLRFFPFSVFLHI